MVLYVVTVLMLMAQLQLCLTLELQPLSPAMKERV
jgi:hypothetical protein